MTFFALAGMKIIEDPNALEAAEERLFPESRHRSKRILKKLIKRHGGEFKMVPAVWVFGERYTIICHPARYAEIEKALT